ncbi:uncharacterized protein LACBIDRAFT_325095 [Laccaria bicolor S238N-H82]|uniref:Predicted protein n=1 Tax=Laccaria bicolor (strain S238N-H82 / ATCC MYA-4686) TaxID=486041 RepID=B0D241_LACBS|nr:uncharacterized protein LACBIDRAFT_325095 [Laccaria bicolor S238N-H82]EDR11366.1 predicted protein [Laccaria bicolor S238N-H82]|eukprot:XP_001878667.1 predicted protein [Laccaria bicolor S238N-H82]
MKEIRDLITNIKRRDKSFDIAGILVYSGRNLTVRNKTAFFMSSEDLHALCTSKSASSSMARARTSLASALKKEASSDKDVLPYTKERQKQFTRLFLDLLNGCLAEKDRRTSAPWTTWPNLAYQFKLVITGWDSAMVDIAFCPGFAPTKITSSQWKHLSTLIVKKLLVVKPWSDGKLTDAAENRTHTTQWLPISHNKVNHQPLRRMLEEKETGSSGDSGTLSIRVPRIRGRTLCSRFCLCPYIIVLCPLLLPLSTYTPHSTLFFF